MRALVIGNSDGIGLATTRALLARGHEVTGISRRAAPIAAPGYDHIVQDVTEPRYRDVLNDYLARHANIDLCIYCAGIGARLDLNDLARQTQTFAVNLMAAVITTEVVLGHMIARDHGHFIGLSSIADLMVSPQAPAYTASKAGISRYWEGLGRALAGRKPKLSNVRFGFVDTKMADAPLRPLLMTADAAARFVLGVVDRPRLTATKPFVMTLLARLTTLIIRSPLSFLFVPRN